MKEYGKGSDVRRFSPRATLAAIGLKLRATHLFGPVEALSQEWSWLTLGIYLARVEQVIFRHHQGG